MSLVHEALIGVLNRHFVSCYFNSFTGPGSDAKGSEYIKRVAKAAGMQPRYGAIVTPDGEMLVSFGYSRKEFFTVLRDSLRKHPEFDRMTVAEQATLDAAKNRPGDLAAQLSAAGMLGELLRFDAADDVLKTALKHVENPLAAARLHYLRGHLALLNLGDGDEEFVRSEFEAMGEVPDDLVTAIAIDRLTLAVQQRQKGAFFTGWEFRSGTDLVAAESRLRELCREHPDDLRIGQLHLYLGMALHGQKKPTEAEAVWRKHHQTWPEDRFAMVSRVLDTSYKFSPYRTDNRIGGGVFSPRSAVQKNRRPSASTIERMKDALEEGDSVRVFGRKYSGERLRKYLEELGVLNR